MIKNFFLPNHSDARYGLLSVLVVATFVVGSLSVWPEFAQNLTQPVTYYRYGLIAILAGLTVASFRRDCHLPTLVIFVSFVVAGPWLVEWLGHFVRQNPTFQFLNLGLFEEFIESKETRVVDESGMVLRLSFVLIVIAIANTFLPLGKRLKHNLWEPLARIVRASIEAPFWCIGKLAQNRARFLVGIVVGLLVIKLLMKLLQAWAGVSEERTTFEMIGWSMALALIMLILFALRFYLQRSPFWKKVIFALLVLGGGIGVAYWLSRDGSEMFGSWATGCCCVLVSTLSFFAPLRSSVLKDKDELGVSPVVSLRWLPSAWSLVTVGVLLVSTWSVIQVDEREWWHTGSWQQGVKAQQVRWQSGGSLEMLGGYLAVNLQENHPKELLEVLEGETIDCLQITGAGPKVDFSPLVVAASLGLSSLNVSDCKLEREQLGRLLELDCTHAYISQVEIVEGDSRFTPVSIGQLVALSDSPSFLTSIESWENVGDVVAILEQPHSEVYHALSLASQSSTVRIRTESDMPLSDCFREASEQLSISLRVTKESEWEPIERLLRDTKIGSVMLNISQVDFMPGFKLKQRYPERLELWTDETPVLAFEKDSSGHVTGLLLPPENVSLLTDYPHLKTLSLDPTWVGLHCSYNDWGPFDFKNLPQLESLSFSPETSIDPDTALMNLENLRWLQIPSYAFDNGFPDSLAPNLETLVFSGVPDAALVASLLKRQKLKSLTIIDLYSKLSSPEASQDLDENLDEDLGQYGVIEEADPDAFDIAFDITRAEFLKAFATSPLQVKILDGEEQLVVAPAFEAFRKRLSDDNAPLAGE